MRITSLVTNRYKNWLFKKTYRWRHIRKIVFFHIQECYVRLCAMRNKNGHICQVNWKSSCKLQVASHIALWEYRHLPSILIIGNFPNITRILLLFICYHLLFYILPCSFFSYIDFLFQEENVTVAEVSSWGSTTISSIAEINRVSIAK